MSHKNNDVAIRQANALTTATYDLERNEKRLIYLAINSIINEKTAQRASGAVIVDIRNKDYADAFNCTASNAGAHIEAAVTSLATKEVIFYIDETKRANGDYEAISWTIRRTVRAAKGITTIHFNEELMNIITKVDRNFTKFLLTEAGKIKSKYVMRLFESISQWQTKGELTFDREWMIEHYCMPASFSRSVDFRKRFLEIAVKEINEKTSLKNFRYEENLRKGRNGHHKIKFMWDTDETKNEKISYENEHDRLHFIYTYIESSEFDKVSQEDIDFLKQNLLTLINDDLDLGLNFTEKLKACQVDINSR